MSAHVERQAICLIFFYLVAYLPFGPQASAEDRVGRRAAQKYFQARKDQQATQDSNQEQDQEREEDKDQEPSEPKASRQPAKTSSSQFKRYLTLHFGGFLDDQVYAWGGRGNDGGVGKLNAGVTYRYGEWTNSMDLLFRADFTSYELKEGRAVKMSLLPVVLFPDARSRFPLYFGAAAGPGIFFKQISKESSLSIDYQLIAGLRLFNLVDTLGFLLEAGIKNHFLLFSDGQFNGVFLTTGAVFTF